MLFAIQAFDKPGAAGLRDQLRPAHLEHMARIADAIRIAGPQLSDDGATTAPRSMRGWPTNPSCRAASMPRSEFSDFERFFRPRNSDRKDRKLDQDWELTWNWD